MADMDFFVHESSYVDTNVKIGRGTKIWHFSHIQSGASIGKYATIGQNVNVANNAKIGDHVKIQNNVSIYEGVEIEDYVFCGPSMVFTNVFRPRSEFPQRGSHHYAKTIIKKSVSLGANCTIICGITIGEYAFVGAGSVITKDIPPFALVVGNPGTIKGWVNRKGSKISFDNNGISSCGQYKLKNDKVEEI